MRGISDSHLDPPDLDEGPCWVCGQTVDDCICPECPVCGAQGDPACYAHDSGEPPLRHRWTAPSGDHGLVRSLGQTVLMAKAARYWEEEARLDPASG